MKITVFGKDNVKCNVDVRTMNIELDTNMIDLELLAP